MEDRLRAFINNGWNRDMEILEFQVFLDYTHRLYNYGPAEVTIERVEIDFNLWDCDEILGEGTELMGAASFYGFQLDILTCSNIIRIAKGVDSSLFDALLSVELVADESKFPEESEDIFNKIYNASVPLNGSESFKKALRKAILEAQSIRASEEIWNDKSNASLSTVSVDDSVLVLDDIFLEPDYDKDFIMDFFVRKMLNQLEEDAAYKYIVVSPNIEKYAFKHNNCLASDKEAYIKFWESLGFERTEGYLKEGFCLIKKIINS